jgi:predicted RNA-binding Zn-ribbon protein involved in translation (DUF1610 family)
MSRTEFTGYLPDGRISRYCKDCQKIFYSKKKDKNITCPACQERGAKVHAALAHSHDGIIHALCAVCNNPYSYREGRDSHDCPTCKERAEIVRTALAITDNPQPLNGWISVHDRLPQYNTKVMLLLKGVAPDAWIEFGSRQYTDHNGEHYSVNFSHKVTHWQPLPGLETES